MVVPPRGFQPPGEVVRIKAVLPRFGLAQSLLIETVEERASSSMLSLLSHCPVHPSFTNKFFKKVHGF